MIVLQIVSVVAQVLFSIAVGLFSIAQINSLIKHYKSKKQWKAEEDAYQFIKSRVESIIRNSKSLREFKETAEFKELGEIANRLIKVSNCLKPYLLKLKAEVTDDCIDANICSKEELMKPLEENLNELASAYINGQLSYFLEKEEESN